MAVGFLVVVADWVVLVVADDFMVVVVADGLLVVADWVVLVVADDFMVVADDESLNFFAVRNLPGGNCIDMSAGIAFLVVVGVVVVVVVVIGFVVVGFALARTIFSIFCQLFLSVPSRLFSTLALIEAIDSVLLVCSSCRTMLLSLAVFLLRKASVVVMYVFWRAFVRLTWSSGSLNIFVGIFQRLESIHDGAVLLVM